MRVATVDGLVTLYYDGSKELFNRELCKELEDEFIINNGERRAEDDNWREEWESWESWESWDLSAECKEYFRKRLSWQQVIVVGGVTDIPEYTFWKCKNITRVIFANTVIRVEFSAFGYCKNLVFIKWSLSLEYIGWAAFCGCNLSSVFIPPRCRDIGEFAFCGNANLIIFHVPQNTELGQDVIGSTKLNRSCPNRDSINTTWLKNINNDENFALHRVCSSFEPTLQMILDIMKDKGGPNTFKVKNRIGITPSRHLKENPYAHVTEKEIIEKYILDMMGENS